MSGTGELNGRPNQISDPFTTGPVAANPACTNFATVVRDPSRWINPCAFVSPANPTAAFGTLGRNTIIGPRTNILDFSLNKTTRVTERVALQFCSEIFNIFNHPNFTVPNAQADSAAFGVIGATPDVDGSNPRLGDGGPRVIQFGLKLVF